MNHTFIREVKFGGYVIKVWECNKTKRVWNTIHPIKFA